MKTIYIIFFIGMCLLQWAGPLKMIFDQENILNEGIAFKFKTAPIDPTDPFRGKYITLYFEENSIEVPDSTGWDGVKEAFIILEKDSAGFARAASITKEEPAQDNHLKVRISYVNLESKPYKVSYDLPFQRYYMEESKASEAESNYREAQIDSTQTAYALVYIKNGKAALKDVMINDKSIKDITSDINKTRD